MNGSTNAAATGLPSAERLRRISIQLARALRHAQMGLHLRSDGFVSLNELLGHRRFQGVNASLVHHVVASNDKQRFSLRQEQDGVWWIRANQGHSMPHVNELALELITTSEQAPAVVVHGTTLANWEKIKCSGGLSRMGRNHIHFAAGLTGKNGVISGLRASSQVYIYLDVAAVLRARLPIFRSANGVILSSGANGWIPLAMIAKVEDRHGHPLPFDAGAWPAAAQLAIDQENAP